MENKLKELVIYLSELLKTENKQETKIKILKILPQVYFGTDQETEQMTKNELIKDIDSYINNEYLKDQITIQILHLTQLLKYV